METKMMAIRKTITEFNESLFQDRIQYLLDEGYTKDGKTYIRSHDGHFCQDMVIVLEKDK